MFLALFLLSLSLFCVSDVSADIFFEQKVTSTHRMQGTMSLYVKGSKLKMDFPGKQPYSIILDLKAERSYILEHTKKEIEEGPLDSLELSEINKITKGQTMTVSGQDCTEYTIDETTPYYQLQMKLCVVDHPAMEEVKPFLNFASPVSGLTLGTWDFVPQLNKLPIRSEYQIKSELRSETITKEMNRISLDSLPDSIFSFPNGYKLNPYVPPVLPTPPPPALKKTEPLPELTLEEKTETPVRPTLDMELPKLIKKVQPSGGPSGVVILEITITSLGNVRDVRILRSANPEADNAAIEALKRWKYEPARLNNNPIAVYSNVTVKFAASKQKQ